MTVPEAQHGTARQHDMTGRHSAHLSNEASEQGVASDVEWYTQPQIAGSLVHGARELSIHNIELAKHMAGWQSHLR
jgi:hypothetical protein